MLERMPKTRLPRDGDRAIGRLASRAIADIRVGKRHRHDLGDVENLAQNIADYWAASPDCCYLRQYLDRRCPPLGGREGTRLGGVPVNLIDLQQITKGAFAENIFRKDFTRGR